MSCIACHGWLFRGDRSRYAPRSPLPAHAQRYALPITRLSTASLISRTYLIVRDPGHYRVASLSRGSYVTNGQRMVAVLAAVASVSDRGVNVQPAQQRPQPAPAGDGENASTQASSLRHGERLQPSLTQRDMWVMHSLQRGRMGVGRITVHCRTQPRPGPRAPSLRWFCSKPDVQDKSASRRLALPEPVYRALPANEGIKKGRCSTCPFCRLFTLPRAFRQSAPCCWLVVWLAADSSSGVAPAKPTSAVPPRLRDRAATG